MNNQLRKLFVLLAFGFLGPFAFSYDFDDTDTVDLEQTVNGNLQSWTASLRVYGYNSQGYQQIWVDRDSGHGSVVNTAFREDGSSSSNTGTGDVNGLIVYNNYYTRFTMQITLNDGSSVTLSAGAVPADPCGPINFEKTYTNPTSKSEWYRAYLGETFIDFFIVPPYGSHTFSFQQDEACETLYIIKEIDGEPLIPMDEQAPDAPDPDPNPEFPELGDPPAPSPDFEDTDVGEASGSGNVDDQGNEKSDVEKLVESQWLLWKGTDERLEGIGESLDESNQSLNDIEGVLEEGMGDIAGGLDGVESGLDEVSDELRVLGELGDDANGFLEEVRDKIDDIYDILFFWNGDIDSHQDEEWDNHADSQDALAAQAVEGMELPEINIGTQTMSANGGWPTFTLPIVGNVDTNPYTRFPELTNWGAVCRNVILILIWVAFWKKAGEHSKDYVIGIISAPATNVNTGGENIAFPVHLAKALAKGAAIMTAIAAFGSGLFVLANLRATGLGAPTVEGAFGYDVASMLSSLGPIATLIDTFIPIPEMISFILLNAAFPYLCMPLYFLAGFIIRLIPV